MSDILARGTLFPQELIPELVKMTKGKSALAALCGARPIAFNGQKEFTFTLDKEVDLVAENGAKTKGGATITPVTINPVKVEYGVRVSDEFMYGAEAVQMSILESFADGFSRKLARGLDIMAFHGVNPRTGTASTVIGTNSFDGKVTQTVTMSASATADANVEAAIALVDGNEMDVNGMVMSPAFRSALAALTSTDGRKLYPELAWGNEPGSINGLRVTSNSTLSANSSLDRALVGDFENCFRWGYAKEIPMKVIEYGNPDNDSTLGDLQGHNQVYLRAEAYVGWGILAANAFAFIKAAATQTNADNT